MEPAEFLPEVSLFQDLPAGALDEILAAAEVRKHRRDDVIVRQGERLAHFYLVQAGRAQVVGEDARVGRTHLAYLEPGDFFGDLSMLTGEPASAGVLAFEDCTLLAIPFGVFREILSRHPILYRHFTDTFARRLQQVNLGSSEAESRSRLIGRLLADQHGARYDRLLGKSRAVRDTTARIRALSGNEVPVFLRGEKGVGKELVARLIHLASPHRGRSFLSLDCGEFAGDEWGETLFGSILHNGDRGPAGPPGLVALANGGTILLKNVDILSRSAQERLLRHIERPGSARFMVTTDIDLTSAAADGRFSPALLEVLEGGTVLIPPLRERKIDIPLLASFFVERHARRLNKTMDPELSEHVLDKLVAYDYFTGNVRELEDILERAVRLAERGTIRPEHVFLGEPRSAAAGVDLLQWPALRRLTMKGLFPWLLTVPVMVGFLAIVVLAFFGPQDSVANPVVLIAWSLWWPGLFLSTFVLARFWCAICPFQTLGRLAQRVKHFRIPVPTFVHKKTHVIVTIGFLLIIWVEEISGMRSQPMATGLLILSIAVLAVFFHVLLARQAWCRYLCPLGAMVGVAAMSSTIELRTNVDTCLNRCSTHECYKGTERWPGCPLFQHAPFVDSNKSCTLCLNCFRTCPHDSPRVGVRFPGRELWTATRVSPEMVYFVAALQSVLLPVMAFERGLLGPAAFTLVFIGTTLAFMGAVKGLHLLASRSGTYEEAQVLKQAWNAHVPLAVGGHTAYQLSHLPVVPVLSMQVFKGGADATAAVATVSLLGLLQITVILGGLLLSIYAVWRVSRREEMGRWRSYRYLWLAHGAAVVVYGATVAVFLRWV